jgi:signal transduction histidine kinase
LNLSERLILKDISLESSLDFISDGLIIVNSELEVIMFNQSAKTICGVVASGPYTNWPDFVGVYKEDKKTLYHPEDLPLVRAIRGERVTNHVLYLKNSSHNEWKIVSCNANPIMREEKVMGAILIFREITEVVKAEESIQKERSFYQKILNSMPAYVFSKDMDGNYTFLNDKFKEDFHQIFQKNPANKINFGEVAWSAPHHDKIVVATKQAKVFEEEYPHFETGKKTLFQTTRIPLLSQNNEVYGICGIAYDITIEREQKKALEEEKTKIATASKLAALGVLAAEIGHEINNPLAIIRTSSWIMRKILSADSIQKDLAMSKLDEIDATVQRLSEIVISVKNLSRDSSSEEMKFYLLKDILRDVQSICGPKFQAKGIQFLIDLQNPILNEEIRCFRVQLSEVFINLILNAVDAVENVEHPWVKLEVLRERKSIIFRFSDSGEGVSADIEKKIFTPFFSTKELGKGTGLGLSISKEIMKKHEGDLLLNRSISASCFEITLPEGRPYGT